MFLSHFFSHVNWLAVLVSAVAYFMLGALWYAPPLLGKIWQKLHKVSMTEDSRKQMPVMFSLTFLMTAVIVIGLSILVMHFQSTSVLSGMKIGLLAGGAFAATSISMTHMYTQKPFGAWVLDSGYHVLGMMLASVILSIWH